MMRIASWITQHNENATQGAQLQPLTPPQKKGGDLPPYLCAMVKLFGWVDLHACTCYDVCPTGSSRMISVGSRKESDAPRQNPLNHNDIEAGLYEGQESQALVNQDSP